jgi:hypothetical protein
MGRELMAQRPITGLRGIGFCPLQRVEADAGDVRTLVVGQDRYTWWRCLACLDWHLCREGSDSIDIMQSNRQ